MNNITGRFFKRNPPAIQQVKPKEDHPKKGEYNGLCNITRCQKPGAVWFNLSTRKYYCASCAAELNRVNRLESMKMWGRNICQLEDGDDRDEKDSR